MSCLPAALFAAAPCLVGAAPPATAKAQGSSPGARPSAAASRPSLPASRLSALASQPAAPASRGAAATTQAFRVPDFALALQGCWGQDANNARSVRIDGEQFLVAQGGRLQSVGTVIR